MKTKITKNQNLTNGNHGQETVEVLYQKMGNRWFAFSLIDDEVFVGSIPSEQLENFEEEPKLSGNS